MGVQISPRAFMEIKIYTTPTCVYCQMAKKFFQEHNVKYEEIDVSFDNAKAEEMVQKSGQMAVPVIEINGEIIIGFDKNKISRLLGL